jgi:hypothetical protein
MTPTRSKDIGILDTNKDKILKILMKHTKKIAEFRVSLKRFEVDSSSPFSAVIFKIHENGFFNIHYGRKSEEESQNESQWMFITEFSRIVIFDYSSFKDIYYDQKTEWWVDAKTKEKYTDAELFKKALSDSDIMKKVKDDIKKVVENVKSKVS